jgi:NAD(P)-dependent dehydrogenase (short-subunit alcohol dehydrogenase family)
MRVLLTGGSGEVGKSVVDRLVHNGFSVRVIGRRPGIVFEGAEYQSCDINDYAHLREVIRGCEAVVHLAAIPNPTFGTPEQTFHINGCGTFNVFQAATEEGIKRVIQASSINATGQFFSVKPAPLDYLPIDEEHPVFSTDVYSFSKHVIEEIGEYFWRREGISSLAYRFPYVTPVRFHETFKTSRAMIQRLVEDLLKRSPKERQAWFTHAWNSYNQFRATRPYEKPEVAKKYMESLSEEDRACIEAMANRVNFFTLLDQRDSAQAIEKGLMANFDGAHALFINDSQNWTGVESKILAELFYADVKHFKKDLVGTETLVSIDKACQMVGFEPEYSFDKD